MFKYDKKKFFRNEKGIVLVVTLLIMMVLTLLITTAIMTSTIDLKITGNYKTSEMAFYAAEAGVEEARGRLRLTAVTGVIISDTDPTSSTWERYIGTVANCTELGFNSGNSHHNRVDSLQSNLNYVVKIIHKTNSSGQILYFGDANSDGKPEQNLTTGMVIYVVTSLGKSVTSQKKLTVEICHVPPISVPGALYVEATTTIKGTSTHVLGVDPVTGVDPCGGPGKHGIVSASLPGTVHYDGNPVINGTGNPTGVPPDAVFNQPNMDIQAMIDSLKGSANFSYNVTSTTQTTSSIPGAGDNWGTPVAGATQSSPSTCTVPTTVPNIVYYNTNNTYIRLSGGTQGCGILIVDGDLDVSGGFQWNGVVIVSGSVIFTGGGGKNITGGLLAGSDVDADIVGGDANIIYCSDAINNQTVNSPLRKLSWKEEGL